MVKMRPAITLFITLAVIVAMLALVGVTFGYLNRARAKAQDKSALIEANLIYADVSNIVNKFIGKKPSTGTLKSIYNTPISIQERKGPFNLLAACAPLRAAIPVAWLKEGSGIKTQRRYSIASAILDEIGVQNRLKDTEELKSMLSKALESGYSYEFGESGRLKRDRGYFGKEEFYKVLNSYFLKTGDKKVFKVNWERYFSFGENYSQIDGDFLSSKLVSAIFGIDEQIVNEDFKSGNLRKFLMDNGADMDIYNSEIFAKKAVAAMECSATYSFGKGSYSLKFDYINGKVEGFDVQQ